MDKNLEIGKRIKEFAKTEYGSVNALERNLGVNRNALNIYIYGRSKPGAEVLRKLREAGCDIEWLLTGEKTGLVKEDSAPYRSMKRYNVNRYPVVSMLGAGSVVPYDDEQNEFVELAFKEKDCIAMRVVGDSMANRIENGDIVLVSIHRKCRINDIVAVKMKNGEQMIKRLTFADENKLHFISENIMYRAMSINRADIEICKTVVLCLKDFITTGTKEEEIDMGEIK